MGLAVLPSRLKQELSDLENAILEGRNLREDEVLAKHADWVDALRKQHTFTKENIRDILLQETGKVFIGVLEDAGVFKRTDEGRREFLDFVDAVNHA